MHPSPQENAPAHITAYAFSGLTLCCSTLSALLRTPSIIVQSSYFTQLDSEAQSRQWVCSRSQSKSVAELQWHRGRKPQILPSICIMGWTGTTPTCLGGDGGGRAGGAGLTHVPPPLPGSGAGPSSNLHSSNMAPRLCSISAAARRLLGGPGLGARDTAAVAAARYEPGRGGARGGCRGSSQGPGAGDGQRLGVVL